MLVSAQAVAGTIGGGHLEWQAIALARERLAGDPAPLLRHYALGPSLGQCCGGALDLSYELLQPSHLAAWPPDASRFEVALFGAGHVGRAIVQALAPLPCKVLWIDERDEAFASDRPWPANVSLLCVDAVDAEIAALAPDTRVLIATHSHDLDLKLCTAALQRTDLDFVGLIGSATKRVRFVRRLAQQGLEAAAQTRLICPIGLPGIEGKEPAVIAASVAAQLLSKA